MKDQITPSIAKRIEGLDELRGIAALAVIAYHTEWLFSTVRQTSAGPIAVDIFLIISGFLIGQILLKAKNHPFFFRKFYVRRVFRIAPLSWVAIGGAFCYPLFFIAVSGRFPIICFLFRILFHRIRSTCLRVRLGWGHCPVATHFGAWQLKSTFIYCCRL